MSLRHHAIRTGALLAIVAGAGCATLRPNTDVPPHPITITVINNLTVPTDLSIYAVTTGGSMSILGTASPGDSTSFQMTPRAFSEPYRLLARTPMGRRLWSDQYTVGDANTGEIRWQLVPNILQFFDMPEDSTAKPASH